MATTVTRTTVVVEIDAEDIPLLLAPREAAFMLGMSEPSLVAGVKNGTLPKPVYPIKGHPRWRREDLIKYVESLPAGAAAKKR